MASSGNSPNWAEVASAGASWVALALSGIVCLFTIIQQQSISDTTTRIAQTQSAITEQTNHIAQTQVAISNLFLPNIKVDNIETDSRSPAYLSDNGASFLSCVYGVHLANRGGASGSITNYRASATVLDTQIEINVDDPLNEQNTRIFGNSSFTARSFAILSDQSGLPYFSADRAFKPEYLIDSLNNKVFPIQIDASNPWDFVVHLAFKTQTQPTVDSASDYLELLKQQDNGAVPITVTYSFQTIPQQNVTSDPLTCGYARATKLAP